MDELERITVFTQLYHAAVESALEQHGRDGLPHHGERTLIVYHVKASDGYATFYMPDPKDPEIEPGAYVFDFSSYSLNQVCQSLSVHRLKIARPESGQQISAIFLMPPDTPPIPDGQAPLFHDDVRELAKEGKLDSLPGMTITPIVQVEQGIVKYVVPCRIKIWSPVCPFPQIGLRRLFLWTHADFWWLPEKLDLSEDNARLLARDDVLAITTLTDNHPALPPNVAQGDAPTAAADLLEQSCKELKALLKDKGDDEEMIHQWLFQEPHHIFLEPDHAEIRSKVPMGKRVSDFVIRRTNGTYAVVEIERADKRIYTKRGAEPTMEFRHAEQQVDDWMDFAGEHSDYLRDTEKLEGFAKPEGTIIMGRLSDIDSDEARRRWEHAKRTHKYRLYVYDDLIGRIESLAANLRKVTQLSMRQK